MTHISGGWGSRATSSASCREAVLQVLAGDRELMARFVGACSDGLLALREFGQPMRRVLLERRHRYESHGEQLEETLAAIYDVAARLMPASPGASLARLQERDGDPRNAVESIEDLVASDHIALDKILLAAQDTSYVYVLETSRYLYAELYMRGQRWEPGNFSTHARAVMASLCPPAWDDAWAASKRQRALVYIYSRFKDGDLPWLNTEYAEVYAAEDDRDPVRFSAAIRTLVQSALRVLRNEDRLLPESQRAAKPESSSAA